MGLEQKNQVTREQVDELLAGIMAARVASYQLENVRRRTFQERRVTKRSPIASNINDECAREMYHGIVDWKERSEPGTHQMARMEAGELDAQRLKVKLREWGYKVILDEARVTVKDRKGRTAYSGKIDGAIQTPDGLVPYEAKCYHPNLHGRIDSIEDFAMSEWTRKAPRQLLIYLLAEGIPHGFFILYALGDLKLIPISLEDHLGDAERYMALSEEVSDAIDAGAPPAFAKDPVTCRNCWAFGRVCNPPIETQGASLISDPEFLALLDTVHAGKAIAHQYIKAWEEVKRRAKLAGVDHIICGQYAITVKDRKVKGHHVEARDVAPRTDRIVKMARAGDGSKEE